MSDTLIWVGAALSVVGLLGLLYCIVRVMLARRTLDEEKLRAVIQAVLPLNLGALLLSVLGLIVVVVGIVLG